MTGTAFDGNSANSAGGAIFTVDPTTLTSDQFGVNSFNSTNGQGGAVAASGSGILPGANGTLLITGSTFNNNKAQFNGTGGAIFSSWALDVETSTFTGNTALRGGAIEVNNTTSGDPSKVMYLTQDTFTNNRSVGIGGAIEAVETANTNNVTVNYSTFSNNTAGTDGGALALTVNTAAGSDTTQFANDTFFQNYSGNNGGAMNLTMQVTGAGASNILNLTSLTVYQNTAATAGGGLYLTLTGVNGATVQANVDNNIFDGDNVTAQGYNGPLDVTAIQNGGGSFQDQGFNLVGTTNTTLFNAMNKDILDDNPGLANALAANGAQPGYPQTLALSTDSPGYETGDQSLALQLDERGLTRQTGLVSIGAEDPDAE